MTQAKIALEEIRDWFRFQDFAHFIEVYGAISRCLRTAEDYELIAYELARSWLARMGSAQPRCRAIPATWR